MYSPVALANNILQRSFAEGRQISPMKLQKILYFVASEYQKRTGEPLLAEQFQTWAYGPVSYPVYDEFRSFSRQYIDQYGMDATGSALVADERDNPTLKAVLDEVWDATKHLGAIALSEITHLENSAWDKAYQRGEAYLTHDDITNDTTYRTKLNMADR